jgi:hypothetical protein
MKKTPTQAPLAQTRLSAYPPAPARVELEQRSLALRVVGAAAALAFCWGVLPWLDPEWPRSPLALAGVVLGAWLGRRAWAGRYRVRSFVGVCPRCTRRLSVDAGTRIDLPHTLTCGGCGYQPRLEVDLRGPAPAALPAAAAPAVRHLDGDCAGQWRERWLRDEPFLECAACGGRYYATPAARRAAREENDRGELLARLADEGRFLD